MLRKTVNYKPLLISLLILGLFPTQVLSENPKNNGLDVTPIPDYLQPFDDFFGKNVDVFGIPIVATSGVSDDYVLHAANIMAQYLDTNADEEIDDEQVVESMKNQKAVLIVTENEGETERFFKGISREIEDNYVTQDLAQEEMALPGSPRFDASLEEVLHLITSTGYGGAYPEIWGTESESELLLLTDNARGGKFSSPPSAYPENAWFHYDDKTCDRMCNAVEYNYWALTSYLGAQADMCEQISDEWEPCTREKLEQMDPQVIELMTNSSHAMPLVLPDGNYAGNASWDGSHYEKIEVSGLPGFTLPSLLVSVAVAFLVRRKNATMKTCIIG